MRSRLICIAGPPEPPRWAARHNERSLLNRLGSLVFIVLPSQRELPPFCSCSLRDRDFIVGERICLHDDLGSVDLEQKTLRPFDNPQGCHPSLRDAPLPMCRAGQLLLLVPRKGFEPPTHALRMRCSTS